MAKLNDEMKDLVNRAFAFIATVDENGNPQVGPKGTMRILDDEHLIYNEETGRQAWHNLQTNGKIAVAFHPFPGLKGFRVEGHVKIYESGQIFDDATAYATENKLPKAIAAVVISIDRTLTLNAGPEAGTVIEDAPLDD
ncbi:pyridoxamine 5'-phosphate oxidase family protein [Furfurilactobacillus curtus]|uniref:Sugar ABC transporter substrate-binding protein n=1 Tax=Furfurilactobacillus curtus TaxID=1746200 RepID=A0ABQ5JPD5_9LACO